MMHVHYGETVMPVNDGLAVRKIAHEGRPAARRVSDSPG